MNIKYRLYCDINVLFVSIVNAWVLELWGWFGTKYSGMDQVKFVEDSLWKIWRGMVWLKQTIPPSNFRKAVFHKCYLVHYWIIWLICCWVFVSICCTLCFKMAEGASTFNTAVVTKGFLIFSSMNIGKGNWSKIV